MASALQNQDSLLNRIDIVVPQSSLDQQEDEGLVYNIKHVIIHNTADDYLDELQITQQTQEEQIKDMCFKKADELVRNFSKFYSMKQQILGLQEQMKQFENELDICRKQNQYDKLEIKQKETLLKNIDSTLKLLHSTKEVVDLIQKSIDNLKLKKFQACMRNLIQLKKIQDSNYQENEIIPTFNSLVNQIIPMINTKIHVSLEEMIRDWMKYSKEKQKEFGQNHFTQMENIIKVQIQENFTGQDRFTNQKFSGARDNQSFFKRESNINRQSVYQLNRTSYNNYRASNSIYNNDPKRTTKLSIIESLNNLPGAIPFQKADFSRASRASKMNNMNLTKNLGREWKTDSPLDFFQLKQPQSIYEMMKEKKLFIETFKQNRIRLLLEISEGDKIKNSKQFREFLEQFVGFFVVEKEIEGVLKEASNLQQMWVEGMKYIEKKLKSYFCNLSEESEYIPSKNEIVLFSNILYKIGLESASISLMKIIKDALLQYTNTIISNIKQNHIERLVNCSFAEIVVQNQDDYDIFCRIYDVPQSAQTNENNKSSMQLPFTLILQEIALLINKFIEDSVIFLKGVCEYDSLIYSQLDVLYKSFASIFEEYIFREVKTEIQFGQMYLNLDYLKKSPKFYIKQIESQLHVSPSQKFDCFFSIDQIKNRCFDEMIEIMRIKISDCIIRYGRVNWQPTQKNNSCQEFIHELIMQMMITIQSLRMINFNQINAVLFVSMKEINSLIWKFLVEDLKNYNIVGLINLRTDLLAIFDMCKSEFRQVPDLTDCFRELDTFLFLFLDRKPGDYLEGNNREKIYMYLETRKLIVLLDKYVKYELPGLRNPVPRKRECAAISKKLKEELGIYK
ncbi:hypothetical protein ABPG72_019259 [Tetrahymena utriculariae]